MIQFDEHIFQMGWNHQLEKKFLWNGRTFLFDFGLIFANQKYCENCFFLEMVDICRTSLVF